MGRFSVYSLIFREYDLETVLEKLEKVGVKSIEIRVHEDGVHLSPTSSSDEVEAARRLLEDYGFEVSALASYAKLGYGSDRARAEMELMLNIGSMADRLGADVFRIKVRSYDPDIGYEKIRELFRLQAKNLVEELEKREIRAVPVVEQHGGGDMAHSTGLLLDLLRGLDPERIGVLFDPGNAVREGWLPIELQVDMVRDYVKHVHVKNFEWDPGSPGRVVPSPLDRGIVDWGKAVMLLEAAGYRGYYSLEDFRNIPPEERSRQGMEFFAKLGLV